MANLCKGRSVQFPGKKHPPKFNMPKNALYLKGIAFFLNPHIGYPCNILKPGVLLTLYPRLGDQETEPSQGVDGGAVPGAGDNKVYWTENYLT